VLVEETEEEEEVEVEDACCCFDFLPNLISTFNGYKYLATEQSTGRRFRKSSVKLRWGWGYEYIRKII